MRPNYFVLLSLAFSLPVHGQNAPTQAFREWARDHVHPIASVDADTHDDADLQVLSNIIGGAHVVAFGEPFHGGHEPLAMRNRLIRYSVTRLGFTADLLVKLPDKLQGSAIWNHKAEMRELAMADNLLWVEQRECRRGKILFFAHDEHVQMSVGIVGSPTPPAGGPLIRIRVADTYLRSALGRDLVVIGTYFGQGAGFPSADAPAPPDAHRMEDLLVSISIPRYIMNLHELPSSGPLHDWFQMAHATRDSVSGQDVYMVAPLRAYDAILYIDTITPSPAPQKQ
jgi:erythromycin esterase-like protein